MEQGYEVLRQQVLRNALEPTLGLGIFLRQGMVTWMKAYSLCVPTLPPLPPRCDYSGIPASLVGEITTILAGIVLARKETYA